jgi:hypothetical protein
VGCWCFCLKPTSRDFGIGIQANLCRTFKYVCARIIDNIKSNRQLTRTEGLTAVVALPFGDCYHIIHFPFSSNALSILFCCCVDRCSFSDVDFTQWKRKNVKAFLPDVRSRSITPLFEFSHASPARPSDNKSIKVQMSMEHWRKDICLHNFSFF